LPLKNVLILYWIINAFFWKLELCYTKMTNKMQLCRIIYYSLAALHVSSNIFTHHQEHLNCGYSCLYYTRMSRPAGIMGVLALSSLPWQQLCQHSHDTNHPRHTCVIPEAVIQFRCSWWWAKILLETCRAARE
jgi:hypothetical protein